MASLQLLSSTSACCFSLPCKPKPFTISRSFSLPSQTYKPLAFSASVSIAAFPKADLWRGQVEKKKPIRRPVVCEAAPKKKADSAAKRARQAEKRRIYNKAKKSEMKTRMKKVLEALDVLRKKPEAQAEEILPIEKLIGEAYSAIDKAVKSGTLHRNTGANRKSRLARRKKAVEMHHGWYTTAAATP